MAFDDILTSVKSLEEHAINSLLMLREEVCFTQYSVESQIKAAVVEATRPLEILLAHKENKLKKSEERVSRTCCLL